jgi:hypothetical protein
VAANANRTFATNRCSPAFAADVMQNGVVMRDDRKE